MPSKVLRVEGGRTAALHLREGDFMEVTTEAGRVSLKSKKLVDASDILTAEEAKNLRHGLKTGEAREDSPSRPVQT
jgi:hypothetical protein